VQPLNSPRKQARAHDDDEITSVMPHKLEREPTTLNRQLSRVTDYPQDDEDTASTRQHPGKCTAPPDTIVDRRALPFQHLNDRRRNSQLPPLPDATSTELLNALPIPPPRDALPSSLMPDTVREARASIPPTQVSPHPAAARKTAVDALRSTPTRLLIALFVLAILSGIGTNYALHAGLINSWLRPIVCTG
jgi:hypothetical protein